MIQLQYRWIRNISYFRQRHYLCIITQRDQILILSIYGTVVADGGVGIIAQDINDVSAGVPAWSYGVPEPDQIAQFVHFGVAVEHQVVQRLAGVRTPSAPPEPASVSFVERPPENRDIICLENEKFCGDGIHITKKETIVCAAGVGEGCCQVEGGAVGVDTIPPRDGCIVDEVPMVY